MVTGATSRTRETEPTCSIARALVVVGERWTFLIVRDAMAGITRFAEFRRSLGIAPDVLTDRLATLVDAGVLAKRPYQEPGARSRFSYHLTPSGEDLRVVLGALQQWGDDHCPREEGPTVVRRTVDGDRPVRVAYVDDTDTAVDVHDIAFVRTAAYPTTD